jgi:preprotein translocase subunit SecE
MAEIEEKKKNIFSRFALFVRQVVVELRKVIWPTRSELINYTIVVLFFILLMAGIVALYDYVFTQGVLFIFG